MSYLLICVTPETVTSKTPSGFRTLRAFFTADLTSNMKGNVWVKMKQISYKTKETVYQIKKGLLRNYLIQELIRPSVLMGFA